MLYGVSVFFRGFSGEDFLGVRFGVVLRLVLSRCGVYFEIEVEL